MQSMVNLTDAQIHAVLHDANISWPAQTVLLKQYNHVYRIACRGAVFFLKTYTKDWYGDNVAATGGCVDHEVSAWRCLAAHGLATPEVVVAAQTCANPLERPFIMTRQLRGAPLTTWPAATDPAQLGALLETAGAYLRQAHAIIFRYPGYIMAGGPTAPPRADAWQHAIWSAQQTQREAWATLEQDRPRLSARLVRQLEDHFATMADALAPAFQPPRFTHGDCHASHFFLYPETGRWHVAGLTDMEVASAGDCVTDLLKMGVELAALFAGSTRWWEPLFAGYGQAPDFEGCRLRLLGWPEASFTCHGADRWPGSREEQLTRLLAAQDWEQLFYLR
jgi:hypothetical protein